MIRNVIHPNEDFLSERTEPFIEDLETMGVSGCLLRSGRGTNRRRQIPRRSNEEVGLASGANENARWLCDCLGP